MIASLKILIVFGRKIPFSHREIMLVLLSSRIIATSFCLSPLDFLYRLRLFGIFWDLVFTIFSPKDYSLYQAYIFRAKHNKKGKIDTCGNFRGNTREAAIWCNSQVFDLINFRFCVLPWHFYDNSINFGQFSCLKSKITLKNFRFS